MQVNNLLYLEFKKQLIATSKKKKKKNYKHNHIAQYYRKNKNQTKSTSIFIPIIYIKI